jgi:hypothetical protein
MIALTLATLFTVVAVATALSLLDSWLRGQVAFAMLNRERALARAGFVPMVEAEELRLRGPARFATAATRPFARRLPARQPVPALFAA